ncbi:unnamed protein product [Microthlaspi erraticum]|uniref:Phorbol-ester/DAG-type domain-containing protein n=1 Tax=Microthlaspi erraticum TaxID=1685480 RepID=A0A6D2KHJ0_9BRAS|nr:unnamed protein product [Microthlaspi erraticum]
MEYCGVCETRINSRHHAYSCEECEFFCHIECILRKERPSPLYVKDLYPGGGVIPRPTERNNFEPIALAKKIVVTVYTGKVRSNHIHVMRLFHMTELGELAFCNICKERILDSPWKCEICSFLAHNFCVELGEPSRHRLHSKHPLTLLSMPPARYVLSCDICKGDIDGFNLFCRVCNFITDLSCALKQKHFLGVLGQKLVGTIDAPCMTGQHTMAVVVVSRSYPAPCGICDEILNGKAVSCLKCEEIYHHRCFLFRRRYVFGHPLHSDHPLELLLKSGSKCIACKLNITKYGYHCYVCHISIHTKCIAAVDAKSHYHYLYHFWMKDSKLSRVCCVCGTRCGESFYGCIECNFNAHAECIGFPYNVKNLRHQHTLEQQISFGGGYLCSLCGLECPIRLYVCNHCKKGFHTECIMSMGDREAATEEEQLRDIYIMYIERDLCNLVGETES